MATTKVPIPGHLMVQEDIDHANVIYNDKLGVIFEPDFGLENTEEQGAYFYYNCAPPLDINFSWNQIKIKWKYRASLYPINVKLSLDGLTIDGISETIGEKIYEDLESSYTVEEDIIFDLYNGRSNPYIYKTGIGGTSGKIELELPKRWLHYEDVTLNTNWLEGWTKRKAFTVTNSGEDWDDGYVLRQFAVTYESDMNTDFSDIRFTDSDGTSVLYYEAESYIDSTSAVFNILTPSTVNGDSFVIFMYYGNSEAVCICNWKNVFDLYDNFEDGKYTGRSSYYPNWTKTNGTLAVTSTEEISGNYSLKYTGAGSTGWVTTPYDYADTGAIQSDFDLKVTSRGTGAATGPYVRMYTKMQDSNNYLTAYFYYTSPHSYLKVRKYSGGSATDVAVVTWLSNTRVPLDTVYNFKILDSGTNIKIYVNDSLKLDSDYSLSFTPTHYGFGVNYDEAIVIDNLRVSDYDPDLSYGALGSEEEPTEIEPDTPSEDDTTIYFTLPVGWSASGVHLNVKEINQNEYITNILELKSLDEIKLGYTSLDHYNAIRLGVEISGYMGSLIQFNNLVYSYEVI